MGKDKAIKVMDHSGAGFVLFVSWFGALVYFVNQAHGFWEVVLALLKAFVWPAILLYHALAALGA